jgi:hypothetical protein
MKTYEMVALADNNNKRYFVKDLHYKKGAGFTDINGGVWDWEAYEYSGLDVFIHEDGWNEVEETTKEMSLSQIEGILGYNIKIIS